MRGRKTDNRKDIIVGRARMKGLSVTELAKRTGISVSTLYRKLNHPGDISIGELELMDELIGFSDEEVLYFIRWRRCGR
jgi:lambda repressor-like predicted transcriptional regulator